MVELGPDPGVRIGADATFTLMTRGAHVVLLPLSSNGDSSVARATSVA